VSAGCRSSSIRIDFSEISSSAVETNNGIRRFYTTITDYYAEFYSHADAQWKCTSRKNPRSLNSLRKIRLQQDRFHRWLQFNDLPYSLFINVRAHGGRLTSTVFHLESINIPAREPRRKQRARDERRTEGERGESVSASARFYMSGHVVHLMYAPSWLDAHCRDR